MTGAIYFPSHAYTHYQTWRSYDPARVERDLGFAARLNLDALRVIVGYEFWRDRPDAFEWAFDHLLRAADRRGIGVLPVLFESVGGRPTRTNLLDTDVETAHAVQSPGPAVLENAHAWDGPREFTSRFVDTYGDRVLAVEVMNEPCGWSPRVAFCEEMLRAARRTDPTVPLTVGCKRLELNETFETDLDVYQFHLNDPADAAEMEAALAEARRVGEGAGRPVWLTEWQRTTEEPPPLRLPNYASLAPVVRDSDVSGDFFWQLMLKPAYVEVSRNIGRVNGVFHEDGTVYSSADAAALSGESGWTERRELPRTGASGGE